MTENIAGACVNLQHAHRVQLTSQHAILSFSNILVWTIKNASKRKCGHDSIDAFSMKTKTHQCGQGLRLWLYLFTRIQRLFPADDTCKNSSIITKKECFKAAFIYGYNFNITKSIKMIRVQIIKVVWQRIIGSTQLQERVKIMKSANKWASTYNPKIPESAPAQWSLSKVWI